MNCSKEDSIGLEGATDDSASGEEKEKLSTLNFTSLEISIVEESRLYRNITFVIRKIHLWARLKFAL